MTAQQKIEMFCSGWLLVWRLDYRMKRLVSVWRHDYVTNEKYHICVKDCCWRDALTTELKDLSPSGAMTT